MNLDEYRALKAQEEKQGAEPDAQVDTSTTVEPGKVEETPVQSTTPPEQQGAQTEVQSVTIEGIGEIPIEEIKQIYSAKSELTQKATELQLKEQQFQLANQYYDALQKNPDEAKKFADENGLEYLSPQEAELQRVKAQYDELIVKQEVALMKTKYSDFDESEVLKIAVEKKFDNLEDAYTFHKAKQGTSSAPADIDSIKEQIRQEILAELQSNQGTGSIIGQRGAQRPVQDDSPTLSNAELKVAQGLGMTPKEYAKWRDAK